VAYCACLGIYLLLPWVCLWWFGLLGAIAGAVASHFLYCITLKPQGICLGIPWLAIAVNCSAILAVVAVTLLLHAVQ
jgi:hypothetical protein